MIVLQPRTSIPQLEIKASYKKLFYIYFFFITLTGVFAGAAMPPALELLAESAYPVPEGTSANVVMLFYQVFMLIHCQ